MWPMNKKWLLYTTWTAASALGLAIILNTWVMQEMLNNKKKTEMALTTKPEAKLVLQEAEKPRMSQELKAIWMVAIEPKTQKKSKKLKIDVRNEEPKALVTLGKKVKNPFGPWDEVPVLFESPTWRWSITMFLRYSSKFQSWVACEYTSLILPWNEPATEEIKWITLIAPKWIPIPWTEKRFIEIVDIYNPTSYEKTIATISEELSKRPWTEEDI